MADEQNKNELPNLITKQCVGEPKSSSQVKSCSILCWPVNCFHVYSPDFSPLSAERGIGLRNNKQGRGLKYDKAFWGLYVIVRDMKRLVAAAVSR